MLPRKPQEVSNIAYQQCLYGELKLIQHNSLALKINYNDNEGDGLASNNSNKNKSHCNFINKLVTEHYQNTHKGK